MLWPGSTCMDTVFCFQLCIYDTVCSNPCVGMDNVLRKRSYFCAFIYQRVFKLFIVQQGLYVRMQFSVTYMQRWGLSFQCMFVYVSFGSYDPSNAKSLHNIVFGLTPSLQCYLGVGTGTGNSGPGPVQVQGIQYARTCE